VCPDLLGEESAAGFGLLGFFIPSSVDAAIINTHSVTTQHLADRTQP